MSDKQPREHYHHGDLRNSLIIAAAQLIEEKGSLDFTLAEASRRAGVSSAAPYRHFRNREDLLSAVTEVAFMALSEQIGVIADRYPEGSEEQVIALGSKYIEFVIGHPQFYELMWGGKVRREKTDNVELSSPGFFVMVESVKSWCEQRKLRNQDALVLSVKIWGMAHGLAGLTMSRNIDRFLAEVNVYRLFESAARTFLEGLLTGANERR